MRKERTNCKDFAHRRHARWLLARTSDLCADANDWQSSSVRAPVSNLSNQSFSSIIELEGVTSAAPTMARRASNRAFKATPTDDCKVREARRLPAMASSWRAQQKSSFVEMRATR